MNKELEEMIEQYKIAKDNKCLIENIKPDFFFEFVDLLLNYIENSISKEVIEEKLDNLDLDYEIQQKWDELDGSTAVFKAYKELLKGK